MSVCRKEKKKTFTMHVFINSKKRTRLIFDDSSPSREAMQREEKSQNSIVMHLTREHVDSEIGYVFSRIRKSSSYQMSGESFFNKNDRVSMNVYLKAFNNFYRRRKNIKLIV